MCQCRLRHPQNVPTLRGLSAGLLVALLSLTLPDTSFAQLTGLTATEGVFEDRVVLTWTGSAPVGESIKIERLNLTTSTNEGVIAVRARTETGFIDRSAVRGNIYDYVVYSIGDTLVASGYASVFSPTNVSATYDTREDGVLIAWSDRSAVESGYEVTRDGALLVTTAANSGLYLDDSAVAGQDHSYCVYAVDGNGVESGERCVPGRRAAVTPPGPVIASDGQYPDFVRITFADQSEGEDEFRIYTIDGLGNPTLVGTVDGDATTSAPDEPEVFDDASAGFGIQYEYCVAAVVGAQESVSICDDGVRGLLPLPTNVVSTYGDFDDRIEVTWDDESGVADGYLIGRISATDEVPLGRVGRDARAFGDETASQEVEYWYCVTAFSTVDADSTFSASACSAPGLRTTVLPPTAVTATDAAYEDRVGVTWTDGSTTAMLFNVYREGLLIDNVPPATPFFVDDEGPANTEVDYCVTAVSVTNGAFSVQQSVQMLEDARRAAASTASARPGETVATRTYEYFRAAVAGGAPAMSSSTRDTPVASTQAAAMAIVETAPVCNEGSRELLAPTQLSASYDEFEERVQLSWTDNSSAEAGYIIRRFAPSSGVTLVDTVDAGRQTLGDFAGVPGVEYEYRVTAFDLRGAGGESEADTDVGYRKLAAPTAVQASDGTSETEVLVTWIDNSRFETGYEILRDNVLIGSVGANVTSVSTTGSALGTVHTFAVRATDGLGVSEEDADDGNTAILPPGNVTASEQYSDKVVISWNDESDIESLYWVSRNGVNLSSLLQNATTYTDSAPPGAGPFTYCVESAGANDMRASSCDEGGLATATGALSSSAVGVSELIRAETPVANGEFGSDVAVDGDKAIVASGLVGDQSTPFVFSSGSWQRLPLLVNSSGNEAAFADISGDLAIVGWSFPTDVGLLQFSEGAWKSRANFPLSSVPAVDIDGNRAAAGESSYAGGAGSFQGRVLIYDLAASGTWSESPVLPDVPVAGEQFGRSVAVSGDYLAASTSTNRVVLFRYDGAAWSQIQVLTAPDCGTCTSVAMDGPHLVVSDNTNASVNAHVFERVTTTQWNRVASLTGSNSVHTQSSVDIRGNRIIVGTGGGFTSGAAWIFQRGDAGWSEVAAMVPASSDGTPLSHSFDLFGSSVSISPDFAFIGAPGFDPNGNGSVFIQPLVGAPSDVATSDGAFDDRIQLTWTDTVANEELFNVYRQDGDNLLLVGTTPADGEFYDDFSALPGGTYEYCVTGSSSAIASAAAALGVSEPVCDTGWRPANGTISGQISAITVPSSPSASTELLNGSTEQTTPTTASDVALGAHAASASQSESRSVFASSAADNAVDVCIAPNPNKALQFDGIGGYVSVPYVPATAQRTACAWIKTRAGGGGLSIVNWGSAEAGSFAFFQLFDGVLYYGEVGSGLNQVWTPVAVNTGQWIHVCVVKDGNTATLYVDGQPAGSSAGYTFPITTDLLTIGAARQGDVVDSFFKGEIDDVQLWDVALSQAAIDAVHEGTTTGSEPDVAAYWPFDQASGRVAGDVSAAAAHGRLVGGVHWVDGPNVGECIRTDQNGNYTFGSLQYGEEATFTVRPQELGRSFTPAQKDISLSIESPIENQVDFTDNTQFGVTGLVQFAGTTCPARDIQIQVDGDNRTSTEADGTYALSLFPSADPTDLYRIRPHATSQDPSDVTLFSPQYQDLFVGEDLHGINFVSTKERALRGYYGGSCPASGNLGTAVLRVFTEDGCFDETYPISGNFEVDLPPQKYLVEVVEVNDAPAGLEADMLRFFDDLGAREVDLSLSADTLDFIFRPDLVVDIAGMPAPPAFCPAGFTADDRVLPLVPVISPLQSVPLVITVNEDYGNGNFCAVTEGTVQIFDAISDSSDVPKTFDLEEAEGVVDYTMVGASPNLSTGAFINGVDRSHQKSITAVANVVGKKPVSATEWAVVEGDLIRNPEFVSATSDPFPLLILRDPPGSNSIAYLERGATSCSTISSMRLTGGGAGLNLDVALGFKSGAGFGFYIEQGAALALRTRFLAGREDSFKSGLEICATMNERFATSDDPSWTGEDLFMGVALNLVFARADRLSVSDACEIESIEIVKGDLKPDDAFETTYVYGRSHIERDLIPALTSLIALAGGDTSASGDPDGDGTDETIRLEDALENWQNHLVRADSLEGEMINVTNRSFSSGANYEYSFSSDTSRTVRSETTRIYTESETGVGAVLTGFGYDQRIEAIFDIHQEWVTDSDSTSNTTRKIGYTLSDGDTGDFFTVDVGEDPRYGTPVFKTIAGRSSNPWEPNTQRRDWPEITVNPPVLHDVDPDDIGSFELTLTNRSENMERRQYVLSVPGETNPRNLGLTVTGDLLGGQRLETFTLDGGESRTINLDVHRVSPTYAYENVGLMLYPANDYAIWQDDPRTPFATSDTAFISVYFDAPCTDVSILRPESPWYYNSASGPLELILDGFSSDVGNSDSLVAVGVEYRRRGFPGWLLADSVHIGTIGRDATSWVDGSWTPPQDGEYELRAFSECVATEPGDDPPPVYSDIAAGTVDNKPPVVFGTPEPADQILSLGSDIAISFDEPVACESFITNGAGTNTTLAYASGPNQGALIPGLQRVCDGRKVILAPPPTFDWAAAEGLVLEASVDNITDLAGNELVGGATTWLFSVRRSAFVWSPANVDLDVTRGTDATVTARLINGRATDAKFELPPFFKLGSAAGDTTIVSPSLTSGTVVPGGTATVSFLIPDTLPLGEYSATVEATRIEGGFTQETIPFYVKANVVCAAPPSWTVNAASFEYSMTLTAVLNISGVNSTDGNDRIVALVGNEVRGVANVDDGRITMIILSNTLVGETVRFEVWDHSACTLFDETSKSFVFENNSRQGTIASPTVIVAPFVADPGAINLAAGWTWFSLNKTPADASVAAVLSDVVASPGDVVKYGSNFSIYDEQFGWVGTLPTIDPGPGYQIFLQQSNGFVPGGTNVDLATNPIAVQPGWNWIGYLPQAAQPVNNAMQSLTTSTDGDVIKSQFGFAQFDASSWFGSLDEMSPGLGYQLNAANAGTITYAEPPAMQSESAPLVASATNAADSWSSVGRPSTMADHVSGPLPTLAQDLMHLESRESTGKVMDRANGSARRPSAPARTDESETVFDPRDFETSMTVTATVTLDGDVALGTDAYVWVVDEDGKQRGQGRLRAIEGYEQYRLFLMVYGTPRDESMLIVRARNPESGEVVEAAGDLRYTSGSHVGTIRDPKRLNLTPPSKTATVDEMADLPTEFGLEANFPNPFATTTTIHYKLPQKSEVRITVFDILGREVLRLVDGEQEAGRYDVRLDARGLASGVYVYRLKAGEFVETHKMTIVK